MSNNSMNTLVVFGSLVGITFIIVAGVIALVYSDGASSSIVLPILLGQLGPLIILIMNLARSIENGTKVDNVSTQTSQLSTFMQTPPTPPVVITTPGQVTVHDPAKENTGGT